MKKFLIVTALILVVCACFFSFAACTGRNTKITVDSCWANNETLEYSVHDGSKGGNPTVGTLSVDLKASIADADKKLKYGEEEREYSSATVRINEKLTETGVCEIETTILAYDYTVLATNKTYKDSKGNRVYTLYSYHDGKNYVYTIDYADGRTEKGKINVGAAYTDNEFLYYYVRCYEIGSLPSKTKIADPFSDSAFEISCSNMGTVKVATECTDKTIGGAVDCNKVSIGFSSRPKGSAIEVYYVTDVAEHEVGDYGLKSRKFPAKIVENNISYVLKSYTASFKAE